MSLVVFYEKPGCSGNAFQRALLEASGHTVECRDILKTDWMRLQLLPFLKNLPIAEWFNRSAPLVRSGAINPDAFDASDATTVLSMLIENPILIHRPLLEVDGICRAGFDVRQIHAWIGLSAAFGEGASIGNAEACRRGIGATSCLVGE